MNTNPGQSRQRKRKLYPDGVAIEPRDVFLDADSESWCYSEPQGKHKQECEADKSTTADLFVTMCFYARLGFIQPPTCLKCAYRSSGCRANSQNKESSTASLSTCNNLVPWRIDATIPIHPDKLESNVVFLTCDTASSLVNGDAYPSIRWDTVKKCMIMSEILPCEG
ncbi:hypothetical protein HJC23_003975 [Cyclotella cryptica]|uniref:Uncharacterized protein n=1 Tax=Cyclotella cryptica TaxID=29204 RepID=A0ABD3QUD6_9STRA|eukprot:CCRYP_001946-RB/>CCRYP_001946-RB protein AED:0.09 eAED:0.09 QI:153/1/1/1/0.25/0.2/5/1078/166